MKLNIGIAKYNEVAKIDIVEYLKDASQITNTKKIITKTIFLFLSYL